MPAGLEFLVIAIALVGFWAIVLRPARAQQRQLSQLHAELVVGEEVLISAGIFGTVVELEDDKVRLEIAPGTVITVARQVVVRRVSEGSEAPPVPGPEVAGPQEAGPGEARPREAGPDESGPPHRTTDED